MRHVWELRERHQLQPRRLPRHQNDMDSGDTQFETLKLARLHTLLQSVTMRICVSIICNRPRPQHQSFEPGERGNSSARKNNSKATRRWSRCRTLLNQCKFWQQQSTEQRYCARMILPTTESMRVFLQETDVTEVEIPPQSTPSFSATAWTCKTAHLALWRSVS